MGGLPLPPIPNRMRSVLCSIFVNEAEAPRLWVVLYMVYGIWYIVLRCSRGARLFVAAMTYLTPRTRGALNCLCILHKSES